MTIAPTIAEPAAAKGTAAARKGMALRGKVLRGAGAGLGGAALGAGVYLGAKKLSDHFAAKREKAAAAGFFDELMKITEVD